MQVVNATNTNNLSAHRKLPIKIEVRLNTFRQPSHLPRRQAGRAEQMPAWFYPDVLAVLRANLAHLEGGAHFAVQFVLLLSHLDVVFRGRLHSPAKVRVHVPPVGKQVAEMR